MGGQKCLPIATSKCQFTRFTHNDVLMNQGVMTHSLTISPALRIINYASLASAIEEKIVYLRSTYHFGLDMVVWYLQRCPGIKASRNGCYQVLKRNRLNRLPENIKKRSRNKFTHYETRWCLVIICKWT